MKHERIVKIINDRKYINNNNKYCYYSTFCGWLNSLNKCDKIYRKKNSTMNLIEGYWYIIYWNIFTLACSGYYGL